MDIWTPPALRPTVILYQLLGANMNTLADQPMTRMHSFVRWSMINGRAILRTGTSAASAVGGAYTAAAKGGIAVVPASQTYPGLTAVDYGGNVAGAAGASFGRHTADLIFALSTAHGSAATADIYIYGFEVD